LYLWEEAKDCAVESKSKCVGLRILDGSEWGFGPLAESREGSRRVRLIDGASGVEIVRECEAVGAPELPMFTAANLSPRKGQKDVKWKGRAVEFSEEERARGPT
jgi:hypothetical protein